MIDMKLIFSYRLTGRDAEALISDGMREARMWVWHVSDALGDLLRCVVQVLEGGDYAWCVWEDDPGEHKWVFRGRADTVEIAILRFPTSFNGYGAPEEWAEPIFVATCPLTAFAAKVRDEARRLLNEVGIQEYSRLTGHEFPLVQYEALRRLIQKRRAR